ncbi:MAG: Membrane protein containing DUF6, transrane [Magnetococcales bacterium]|nr:Membrane protein containing DUF6, transrane [Magnetococcales bacterium]
MYGSGAIFSAFFGALANLLAKTILRDVKAKDILGINFLIMTGVMSILSPSFFFIGEDLLIILPLIVLIAFVDYFANYFFFKAFEKSDVSIATPMLALAPGFTFFFSWMFLDDTAPFAQLLLCIGVSLGIIIFSTDFSRLKESRDNTLIPALTSSLLFGFSAIPSKYLLANGFLNAPTLYELRGGLIGLTAIMFLGSGIGQLTAFHFRMILIRGIVVIIQWLLLYQSLTQGSAGVSYTLGNITPIFVFVLSFIFLNERFTIKKGAATLLVLVLSLLVI